MSIKTQCRSGYAAGASGYAAGAVPFGGVCEVMKLVSVLPVLWAAHALDGWKGLLRMLEEDQVLPSHASVAVLVGPGLGRRWAHGGRESDLPL